MSTTSIEQPVLRRARAADLTRIERLLTASDLPLDGVAESLGDFTVAEHDGSLVGVVGLELCCAEYALLRSTAVSPEWRGRRLGRQLVEHAIADAKARGLRALWLLTTTAERYFPSFGFTHATREQAPEEVRASVEFARACPASAIVMTLALPRSAIPEAAPDRGNDAMTSSHRFRILVLCTGNSARSQIAEALLVTRGAGRIEATSAGSRPAPRVNPYAIEVLRAHGIEWTDREPKSIDALEGEQFDLVLTVCDHARDACPFLPGARAQVHWGLPDPAEAASPEEARRAFHETYEELSRRIDALLSLPLEQLDPTSLTTRAGELAARGSVPSRTAR